MIAAALKHVAEGRQGFTVCTRSPLPITGPQDGDYSATGVGLRTSV